MLNLNDLHLFVQAVDCGGFAQAGRRLSMPKSTISKRVGELEARLGTRLIHRTSRSFKLSELGRDFYEHAQAALIEAEAAESVVRRQLAEPSGTVRITASVPVAQFQLAAHLPALAQAYPGMSLVVHATDRFVDLIQEGFDIAVRSHFGPLPNSGLIQRRASIDPVVMVAAPSYLVQRGAPGRPEDIAGHDGLLTAPAATVWRLRADGGQEVQVAPRARMVADESVLLLEAAAAGLGLACLPAVWHLPCRGRARKAGIGAARVDRRCGHDYHPDAAAPGPAARRAGRRQLSCRAAVKRKRDGSRPAAVPFGRVTPLSGIATDRCGMTGRR